MTKIPWVMSDEMALVAITVYPPEPKPQRSEKRGEGDRRKGEERAQTENSDDEHVNGQELLAEPGGEEEQEEQANKGDAHKDNEFRFSQGLHQLVHRVDLLF